MPTKPYISPKVFDAIYKDYLRAIDLRKKEIRRLYDEENLKQQEIADFFKINISRVNRILDSTKTVT